MGKDGVAVDFRDDPAPHEWDCGPACPDCRVRRTWVLLMLWLALILGGWGIAIGAGYLFVWLVVCIL